MGLTVADIEGHPALPGVIRQQSRTLIQAFEANPPLASVFATQQRWLMGHAALALYFRRPDQGFKTSEFLDLIAKHKVASRNTADSFVKEMLNYKFARLMPGGRDRRARPIEPTEPTLGQIHGWIALHLATLDALDGRTRAPTYLAKPEMLARLQPRIADGLLSSPQVREPQKTFSLFTWLNNGGIVMDRLIAGIENAATETARIPTSIASVKDMALWLRLSHTHLMRKLRAAEAMGSLGWLGPRNQSVMWVSRDFYREYATAQAVKLAIIDQAYDAVGLPF